MIPLTAVAVCAALTSINAYKNFKSASGLHPWVDTHTPLNAHSIETSRGESWNLTFSDEFDEANRDFRPGGDPIWTALELPDGVNAALEYYSFNMTSTTTDTDGRGILQVQVKTENNITFEVYDSYKKPPGFQNFSMFYRSGMLQSWNKFCFQGGLLEVMVQLPGATSPASGNPDILKDTNSRVHAISYYPTWPGIWMMGNLGRALFSQTTNRMWPWSYNECNQELEKDQRISACTSNPGYGLNAHQGRGAPEIDILEGGGTDISMSIQIAPGMPQKFRQISPNPSLDPDYNCIYTRKCKTMGANSIGIPTSVYARRGYKTWYQNLKYAPNTKCNPESSEKQDPSRVIQNRQQGVETNTCSDVNACSASNDNNAYIGLKDNTSAYWGVNENGGCMPQINAYQGVYLCDPDNSDPRCSEPKREGNQKISDMPPFRYQMDALSANIPIPLKSYSSYVKYQIEWRMGKTGYVRWIVDSIAVFEIPADSLAQPPQDSTRSNTQKLMIEEPMYLIVNVALSTSWGTRPPSPGKYCQGQGSDQKICEAFPMYLNIDYFRLYQDVSPGSFMAIGCDPETHPTRTWIKSHISEYQDTINQVINVVGGATCSDDQDCSVRQVSSAMIKTGECVKKRCRCLSPASWSGPRCTTAHPFLRSTGPVFIHSLLVGIGVFLILVYAIYKIAYLQANGKPMVTLKRTIVTSRKTDMVVPQPFGPIDPIARNADTIKAL